MMADSARFSKFKRKAKRLGRIAQRATPQPSSSANVNNVSPVNPDAMEMARSLLVEMEAEGRLRYACDLLRHVVWGAEFMEEAVEEVRRRAGRGMKVVHAGAAILADTRIRGGTADALWMGG